MTSTLLDVEPSFKPRHAQVPDASTDNWFTPLKLWSPWHDEFKFTIDAAGHAEAPVSRIIGRFHDIATDGLQQDYAGERVWNNCPYSDIAPWTCKAAYQVATGCLLWAMLLPSWTDREWWHEYVEPFRTEHPDGKNLLVEQVKVDLRFVKGRVKFGFPGRPEGGDDGGFDPSVLVLYRPRVR